ncbi:hypothetical protein JCGZ_11966 [Jatropha curcas]|uniref:Uncharacterized protein n=1 Tax=Jatropha curcas TaxID=180498 RepID=A0A067KI24_JATCU|nr:hypothetical protein JCGZ_11966 [Jatropha curcas]
MDRTSTRTWVSLRPPKPVKILNRGFTRARSKLHALGLQVGGRSCAGAAGSPEIDARVELQWWRCAIWWRSSWRRNCRLDGSAPGGRQRAGAATRLSARRNSGGAVAGVARGSDRAEENGYGARWGSIELVEARSASASSGVAGAGKERKEKKKKKKKEKRGGGGGGGVAGDWLEA